MAGLILPFDPKTLIRGAQNQIPRVGEVGGLALPTPPALARTGGDNGALSQITSIVQAVGDDNVVFNYLYQWIPSEVGGYVHFNFAPTTGWQKKVVFGDIYAGNAPSILSGQAMLNLIDLAINNSASGAQVFYILLELVKT